MDRVDFESVIETSIDVRLTERIVKGCNLRDKPQDPTLNLYFFFLFKYFNLLFSNILKVFSKH